MSEEPSDDQRLLSVLFEQSYITPAQKSRLERAINAGRPLIEALQTTPVIDPLDLIKARDFLRRSSAMVPKIDSSPDVQKFAATTSNDENTTGSFTRDEDGVQVVDWEELDFRRTPLPLGAKANAQRPAVKSTDIEPGADEKLEHLAEWLATTKPFTGGLVHDLAADDGIGLVKCMNKIILNALESNRQAFQIAWSKEAAFIAEYDASGQQVVQREEDQQLVEKIAAHLKVLARISPWKDQEQQGILRIMRRGTPFDLHVRSQSAAEMNKLTTIIASAT